MYVRWFLYSISVTSWYLKTDPILLVRIYDPYQTIHPNLFVSSINCAMVFFRYIFYYSGWVPTLGPLYPIGHSALCHHYIIFTGQILVTVCAGRGRIIIWNHHRYWIRRELSLWASIFFLSLELGLWDDFLGKKIPWATSTWPEEGWECSCFFLLFMPRSTAAIPWLVFPVGPTGRVLLPL